MADFDPQCITYSQMNLIANARIYYRRLVTWTRAYLLSRYYGMGTMEALFERLYLETSDIGRALYIIFGREAGERYSELLSQYAIIFHELISAQLAGDINGVNQGIERIYQNIEDQVEFFESTNPYMSSDQYRENFTAFTQNLLETANAIFVGDFERDMELYESLIKITDDLGNNLAQAIYSYIVSGGNVENQDVPCIR